MSVVLLYCGGTHVTRTWSMVTPDTSLFGRRRRAPPPPSGEPPPPWAMRPRARAPRVRRFVLLMYLPALVRRPRCWRGIRYARAYPVPAEPGLA